MLRTKKSVLEVSDSGLSAAVVDKHIAPRKEIIAVKARLTELRHSCIAVAMRLKGSIIEN